MEQITVIKQPKANVNVTAKKKTKANVNAKKKIVKK